MRKGRIIVIESLGDNYGKTEISKGLKKELGDCKVFNFPSKLNPMGILINELLNSREVDLLKSDPIFLANLYMLDFKSVLHEHIKKELEKGKDVILDRYYFSTMTYQTAINEMQGNLNREGFSDEILRVATEQLGLPEADKTILLVDPHNVARTMENKTDQFETNKKLQKLVKEIGLENINNEHFENVLFLKITNPAGERATVEENVRNILNFLK